MRALFYLQMSLESCRLLTSLLNPSEPLSPELVDSFQKWLLRAFKPSTTPSSVSSGILLGDAPADLLFSNFLEGLVLQEEEQRGKPSGLTRAKDAAFGFFSRFSKGSTSNGGVTSESSDVRLSHYIANFGPQHIAGDRVPSASAAASRPPPSFVTMADGSGGIKVPTAAVQFAAANGGFWPLLPCRAGSDSAIVTDGVACGTTISQKDEGGGINSDAQSVLHQPLQHKPHNEYPSDQHLHNHQNHHHHHSHHTHTHQPHQSSTGSLSNLSAQQQLQPLSLCPVHTPLMTRVKISNVGRTKAILSLRPLQSIGEDGSYVLSVEPATITLKKGESAYVNVALRILRPNISVNAFVVVETTSMSVLNASGRRMLLLVRARSERTYFGVRLADVPTVRSGGYDSIPLPLAQLRDALLGGQDGGLRMLQTEGLFRVAPSSDEKNAIRQALDDGSFTDDIDINNVLDNDKNDNHSSEGPNIRQETSITDSTNKTNTISTPPIVTASSGHIHGPLSSKEKLYYAKRSPIAVAHMIKVFLRELPSPLFSAIPTETLLRAASEEDCIALIGWLTPPASSIFAWLVDLLVEVARHEAHNKMGLKNLAICTGPNLFSTDENVNPMEALMTSQKSVSALFQIISARAHQTEAKGKNGDDTRDIFADLLGVSARPVKNELVHNELLQKATPTRASINALMRESESLRG